MIKKELNIKILKFLNKKALPRLSKSIKKKLNIKTTKERSKFVAEILRLKKEGLIEIKIYKENTKDEDLSLSITKEGIKHLRDNKTIINKLCKIIRDIAIAVIAGGLVTLIGMLITA